METKRNDDGLDVISRFSSSTAGLVRFSDLLDLLWEFSHLTVINASSLATAFYKPFTYPGP